MTELSESNKEILSIILAIIVVGFIVNLSAIAKAKTLSPEIIFFNLILIALVVLVNIFAKKIAAYLYESKIEHKIWMVERYWFKKENHFNKPVPAGIIVPFILSVVSYGYFMWMSVLQFDVYSTTARTSRMHGIHRFTEMTEIHIGLIAAAGVIANLIAAVIGYIAGFPEFSRLSTYYACFSLIPLGQLDGAKIFFSSGSGGKVWKRNITLGLPVLWVILAVISLIFLFFAWIPY